MVGIPIFKSVICVETFIWKVAFLTLIQVCSKPSYSDVGDDFELHDHVGDIFEMLVSGVNVKKRLPTYPIDDQHLELVTNIRLQ